MPPSPATDTLSLTAAVDALHGSGFPAALVRLIQQQVAFDSGQLSVVRNLCTDWSR